MHVIDDAYSIQVALYGDRVVLSERKLHGHQRGYVALLGKEKMVQTGETGMSHSE